MGAFKTPTLRNVELTGPYMHNGGMKSLTEVVQFYTRGADFKHANIDDLESDVNGIPDLQGNPAEIAKVVEFLKHLTAHASASKRPPSIIPNLCCPTDTTKSMGKYSTATSFSLPTVAMAEHRSARSKKHLSPDC
jgi:hypothetical protein